MGTGHCAFDETHRKYNTKSEPQVNQGLMNLEKKK